DRSSGRTATGPSWPASAPYLSGRLRDDAKLGPFIVDRERVAEHRRREPALRRDREALEGDVTARSVDPSRQFVGGLEIRPLGCDQAEDHPTVARYAHEWLETPRTRVVVLEEQALRPDGPEELLGNRVVADRKSTRLNSSHRTISYAVFCLKKKKDCHGILFM